MRTSHPHELWQCAAGRFVALGALLSVALFVLAASAYPGGSHFDHHASGHDFFRNSLCDVARSTAIGGDSNLVGAALARLSMTIMALGIGALFWVLPERFPSSPRMGWLVRVLGTVATPAAIAVVFLPTDRYGSLHGTAIVAAGIPGLTAAAMAVAALLREPSASRLVGVLGTGTLVVGLFAFLLYVHELVTDGPPRAAVPTLEHVAAVLLVAWMLAATKPSWRSARGRLAD